MNAEPLKIEVVPQGTALSPEELDAFTQKLVTAMKTVFDRLAASSEDGRR